MSKTIKSLSTDAGKGDKPRPTNLRKYRENYDAIFRKKDAIPEYSFLPCYLCSRITDAHGHCEHCKITTALDPHPLRINFDILQTDRTQQEVLDIIDS